LAPNGRSVVKSAMARSAFGKGKSVSRRGRIKRDIPLDILD
jgi:hypothetical protein